MIQLNFRIVLSSLHHYDLNKKLNRKSFGGRVN